MSVHEKMTAIADAIREKTGGTEKLTLDRMAEAIAGIEAGGGGGAERITGSFTATKTNYVLTHNCGFENYLIVVTVDIDSIPIIEASTAMMNTAIAVGQFGDMFAITAGEETIPVSGRSLYRYWHGTQTGYHYNQVTVTINEASYAVPYTVAGATYNYIIIDLGAGT